jgi:dinuclear metal center YbgI/SA1388 family protein
MTPTVEIAQYLDEILDTAAVPDYPNAVNGLQLANNGGVSRIAACVDFSSRTVSQAVAENADFMLVHHGMFWGGIRPLTGAVYDRLKHLLEHDIAVYSSHLPLDRHDQFGNNVLLCEQLGLVPSGGFADFRGSPVGVRGEGNVATQQLVDRARSFARARGGDAIVAGSHEERRTTRWALCTGAGASAETLAEAAALDIDTLIVGEGPHHTAVDAEDRGIAVIYAGHYATETLGVAALAEHLADRFDLEWVMLHAPTGL